MPLDPSEYLNLTRLSGDCSAFIVGANEAHVTVLSQQRRALNLAFALDAAFLGGVPRSVGIVGGGFAGITAATALALRGHNVTIYEQASTLIPVQSGCEKRHIDPHIYDWPAESWDEIDAGLPTLNWQAGPATRVRERVIQEFERIRKEGASGEIEVRLRTVVTAINGDMVSVHDLQSKSFDRAQHSAIVLAAGFGEERTFPGLVPYWHDDDLDQTFASELDVHISGTGDGALVDALRASTTNFSLAGLRQALETHELQTLRRDIVARNTESPAGATTLFLQEMERLERRDKLLRRAQLFQQTLGKKRSDTSVVLSGTTATPWEGGAFPLNRFLIYLLAPLYLQLRYESHQVVNEKIHVKFVGGQEEECSRLLLRHGPRVRSSDRILTWARTTHAARWDTLGSLDLTRRPLYPAEWLRSPRQANNSRRSGRTEAGSHTLQPSGLGELSFAQVESVLESTRQVQNSRLRLQLPRPVVPEAFVALSLSNLPENSSGGNQLLSTDFIALAELLLPERGDILLTAGAGAGKSTLAQYITHCALCSPGRIGLQSQTPTLFLNLPQVVRSPGSVSARISSALSLESESTTWDAETVERFLRSRNIRLAVLDALDEVPIGQERSLAQVLQRLRADGVRMVITCRNASLHRFTGVLAGMVRVWIQPLSEYEVSAFAAAQLEEPQPQEFMDQWRAYGQHGDMITPLLVMMALIAFIRDGAVPEGRSALYRDYVTMLFFEAMERKGRQLSAANLWSAAKCIAEKSANEFGALQRPTVSDCLREHIPQTLLLPDEALTFFVEDIGLLEDFGKRVRFSHSSFFEYFLAHHVAESLHGGKLKRRWLAEQWRSRKYSEVIVFAVQIASSEGFAVAAILNEISEVTAFATKCDRVAELNLSEVSDLTIDDWEEYDEFDGDAATQNTKELISDAGEALAYVVRCGVAMGNRATSEQLEQIAEDLINAVLKWFRADYLDNTTVRTGELALREGIHETLVRVCRMAATSRQALRVASQKTDDFGRATCLRMAAALAEATKLEEDVKLLAQCVESGEGSDERYGLDTEDVDEYELQCEETALSTLYELDTASHAFREAVLSRLAYWEPLTRHSDRYEKLLRLAISSDPVRVSADLGPRLLSFATATERRIQLLFRSAPAWIASLIAEALGDRVSFSFDEVDTMALLWSVESQRINLVNLLNDFLRELLVDSNAMAYLLACVPELRFYDEEALIQMASDPNEFDEFPNGQFVYEP